MARAGPSHATEALVVVSFGVGDAHRGDPAFLGRDLRTTENQGKGDTDMRARHRARGRSNGNGGRQSTTKENQGSFNVLCIALALGGNSHTEPCESSYED
jgi:hypothetical protein